MQKQYPHLLPHEFICDLSWIAGWLTSQHIGRGEQDPVDPTIGLRRRTTTSATTDHRGRLSRPSPEADCKRHHINYNEEEEEEEEEEKEEEKMIK